MTPPWRIRTIIAGTSERQPLLVDRATGLPLFDPTIYVLTEMRARNQAATTIQQYLVTTAHSNLVSELFGNSG